MECRQLWCDPAAFRRTGCNIPGRQDLCHYGSAGNYFLTMPAFGAPNHIGYVSNSSVTPDAPRVGEIRSLSLPMRLVQFGMKLYF